MHDTIWLNAKLAPMAGGAMRDGALAATGGRISWIGERRDWKDQARAEHDAHGAWILPAFVDCHTHLVYAGNRAHEFELRLNGASYEDIAKAGGGILSTVRATRETFEDQLVLLAQRRLQRWIAEGAAVVEVKSGYGLDRDTELKMLRAARRLTGVTVKTTFLGAHTLPEEYKGRADAYIDFVCDEVLPAAAREKLVDAVDVFCERIAFSRAQTVRVFDCAKRLGLPVKLHADQLSDLGGAALAGKYGALSADHLEYSSEQGVEALSRAGSAAVLLPGAFYFLREMRVPPIAALRRNHVPIALATDHNPGSSPLSSPLLAMNMACTLFHLTPDEALAGFTVNAARALGMETTHGTLEAGKAADFALWEIESPAELAYAIGANPCVGRVRAGNP